MTHNIWHHCITIPYLAKTNKTACTTISMHIDFAIQSSYHVFICNEYTLHKTICKDYTQEILSTTIRGRAIKTPSRQVARCSIQKENFYAYQLKRDNWIKSKMNNKRICLSTIPFLLWFVFLCLEINMNTPSSWFALYQHLEIYFFLFFPWISII